MPASTASAQSHFHTPFFASLDAASELNSHDEPNYYAQDPKSLTSVSNIHSFHTGTGSSIYRSVAPLLESTNCELILVTCFWANSNSLDNLNAVLRKLSDKAIRRGTEKIRVDLCLSSSSLFQKLFHKQTIAGQTYPFTQWTRQLGLPDPSDLGGIDLRIKSVFLLPFCVMHPKFVIIDRKMAILPSCNISWEEWFEGCITMSGPIVDQFLKFYSAFWVRSELSPLQSIEESIPTERTPWHPSASTPTHAHIVKLFPTTSNIPTLFLPSPHRRNPHFQPFISPEKTAAPPTPLNTFLLTLFAKADRTICIQTPNLTSPPVLSAVLSALRRGVAVTILTSQRLMILEQLITAGTTTSRCLGKLIKRYKCLYTETNRRLGSSDEEAAIAIPRPGRLRISYFEPARGSKSRGQEGGEPQQSHLKMTVVDGEVVVLGSGNLDRASWYTSQELGVAFFDKTLVTEMKRVVDEAMEGRSTLLYDSDGNLP